MEYSGPERRSCNHDELQKDVSKIKGAGIAISVVVCLIVMLFYSNTSSAIDRTEKGINDLGAKLDQISKQVGEIANNVSVINERTKTNRDEIRSLREKQEK